jgi:uncharacterized protein
MTTHVGRIAFFFLKSGSKRSIMLLRFLQEIWMILTDLAPYLFLGSVIATVLKFTLPADFVSGQLGRPNLASVLKSVFLGLPMPLCSCGVIPAAIGLKKSGASNGAVVGFMISTPQTGADSLLITASFLGWPMALFAMVTTFLSGILGGVLVHLFAAGERGQENETPAEAACALTASSPIAPWRRWLRYAVDELIGGIYRYLAVGVLVGAAISLFVPPLTFARFPVFQGLLGMIGVLAIAVPLYVCTNGSVPIAASLVRAGLPAGSALVFLMAGSATNVATLGSVFRVLGRRVMLIYLGTIIFCSLGFAVIFQSLWGSTTVAHIFTHHQHAASPVVGVISALSAGLLLALMARWAFLDLRIWIREKIIFPATAAGLEEMVLEVDGMTCVNCASHIKRDLELVPGVARVEVNLEKGLARMWGRTLDRQRLSDAVCKAGYTVRGYQCP